MIAGRYPTFSMTKDSLFGEIENAIPTLIELARKSCNNRISENLLFIHSEIRNDSGDINFFQKNIQRKRENERKSPTSLNNAIAFLESIYGNLYDINLYIYKATRKYTIIEIHTSSSHLLMMTIQTRSETTARCYLVSFRFLPTLRRIQTSLMLTGNLEASCILGSYIGGDEKHRRN